MTEPGQLCNSKGHASLNPRSCAASSMTCDSNGIARYVEESQSAFVRGFIDDTAFRYTQGSAELCLNPRSCAASSMTAPETGNASMRACLNPRSCAASSMTDTEMTGDRDSQSLNPRSCAASSMTRRLNKNFAAFCGRLNPRSCAASSMTGRKHRIGPGHADVSIRVRARLHR